MNKAEMKAYAAELAQSLPEEKRAGFLEAFDDDKIQNGFIPRPEFSRALDDRDKRIKEYDNWYATTAKPAYDANLKGLERLQKYEAAYGQLDEDAPAPDKKAAAAAAGITKAELDKILAERDQAYVGLTKTAVRIAQDHMLRFKEPLDVDAVEKFALEKGLPLDRAYSDYIAPRVDKAREEDHAAELKKAREEGAREERSRRDVPHESAPRGFHPLYDQKHVKAEEMPNVERHARDAFLEAFNNPEPVGSDNR